MNAYFFTPYHDAGLGYAYNQCCAIVPNDDDWICLLDADVMLFPSDFGRQIRNAVQHAPQFDLFTCRATRIYKNSQQQYPGPIREERDLVKLHDKALQVSARAEQATELSGSVSGFFLLFRKKLWKEIQFPVVGSKGHHILGIDTEWVIRLRAAGKRVGLLNNLLAVHYYRLGTGDQDKSHLV